jgi:hypothetical protein
MCLSLVILQIPVNGDPLAGQVDFIRERTWWLCPGAIEVYDFSLSL